MFLNSGSSQERDDHLLTRWAIYSVAAAAPLFALLSWDHGLGLTGVMAHSRAFSAPVVLVEVFVVIIAVVSGHSLIAVMKAMPRWSQTALSILVAVAIGTAAFVAVSKPDAWVRTYIWIIHLLFGLSVFSILRRSSTTAPWPRITIGLVVFVAILSAFVASIPDPATYDWVYMKMAVTNVRQLGFYSAAGTAAALGLAFCSDDRMRRMLALSAGSLLAALSFWSGTRSSLLAVIAAYIVAAVLLRPARGLRPLAMLSLTIFAGGLLSMISQVPDPHYGWQRIIGTAEYASDANLMSSGRLTMWKETLEKAGERPLFGHGESQFRTILPVSQGAFNHPHNAVLQMIFAWGFVGAACFFGLLVAAWLAVLKRVRADPYAHLPAFMAANALLAMSMIEGSLYHPWPVMITIFALASVLAAPRLRVSAGDR